MSKNNLNKLISDKFLLEKVEQLVEQLVEERMEFGLGHFASSFNNLFFAQAENGKNNHVEYSKSIKDVVGYSAEEIQELPNKLASIIHEDDRLRIRNCMSGFLAGNSGDEISVSYRIINNNEEDVWLNENLQAEFDDNNNCISYKSVIINISDIRNERKKLEETNRSLIDLDKMKDKFISVISHDLKSPYTTILGFSEILVDDDSLHEKEKKEYLSYIYDGSRLQLNLIEHLLDWSRLRTGRIKTENQRLNLRNLISTVVSKQTGSAVRKNIEITQNVPLNLFINSDEKQLSKAVSDILSNAIKYSHQNSKVILSADKFKDGMIEIVVTDNGIGIIKDDQEKLFRLDHKFSKNGTNGEPGSGMGLIVVKEIIDKLHGDIWFYSTEGEGSEFHIIIPEAKNQILLINPSEEYLNKISKLISEYISEYEIIKCKNGFEALDFIETELPSIVIVKDNMPMMNGVELVRLIRNKDKYFSVSILVLVSELSDEVSNKYEAHIVDHFLLETTSDNDLIHTVNRLLK